MGREEQTEEREVLDAIFPEEITNIDEHSFRVSIALDVTPQDGEDEPLPTLLLTVTYPESYPDTAPDLTLGSPPNAPKHPYLDISTDRDALLTSLAPTVSDNLGMAMIFPLVTTVKDLAEQLIIERQAAAQAVKDLEAKKAEEAENAKFVGTAVTRETFLAWREEFRQEMEENAEREREEKEAEERKKGVRAREAEKLTGRQLWERGLVGKEGEEEDGEDAEVEGARAGVGAVKVGD